MTTAGGLVFVGRSDGRLTALDSSNGNKLWEFQTDGGVNAMAPISRMAAKSTGRLVWFATATTARAASTAAASR